MKLAIKVLTDSDFSKREIYETLKADSEVFYSRSTFQSTPPSSSKKNIFITIGSNDFRKNTNFLFDAFTELRLKLIIVGQSSKNLKGYNNIKFNCYSDIELKNAILNSKALVSASLYEGFNLPPLEAQSLGVPIILSDIPVHREVYGNSALYFNLESLDDLNAAINKLNCKKFYSNLVTKGYANVRRFIKYRNNYIKLKKYGVEFNVNINKE